MDYDSYDSYRRRPQTLLQRHPLGGRLVVIVGFFVLLVPILRVFSSEKAVKVKTPGLEGVAVMTPIVTQPPSTLPPTVVITEIATLPAPAPTSATVPAVAIEALPPAVVPQAAAVAPLAPASKKPTTTFDIQSLPDAVPVNPPAPAPAAKPVATTAKPAATTAKPATTTAKPVTTTAKPASKSTAPASKPTPTTAKPAPTTTAKPNRQYSTEEVKSLIRQMWPADSVDKALDVAWKESNYLAGADNGFCCLGVFQINYASHQRRLAARGLGRNGLFDARVNIEIALEIFREQGWSPWTTA
jgi:cell wall-associated NlpC family hydrolase